MEQIKIKGVLVQQVNGETKVAEASAIHDANLNKSQQDLNEVFNAHVTAPAASGIVQLGIFRSSLDAETEAALAKYAGDSNIQFMFYTVVADEGNYHGLIMQQISGIYCYQFIHYNEEWQKRMITFTDKTWKTVESCEAWHPFTASETQLGFMSIEQATIVGLMSNHNAGMAFESGFSTLTAGETRAANAEIAGNATLKWFCFKYGTSYSYIMQEHNELTTVQYSFCGSTRKQRTITFTAAHRKVVASVGSWTNSVTDVGVTRNANTVTLRWASPLAMNNNGAESIMIGSANNNLAGILTAADYKLLHALDTRVAALEAAQS